MKSGQGILGWVKRVAGSKTLLRFSSNEFFIKQFQGQKCLRKADACLSEHRESMNGNYNVLSVCVCACVCVCMFVCA